jgi:hypothetical protein
LDTRKVKYNKQFYRYDPILLGWGKNCSTESPRAEGPSSALPQVDGCDTVVSIGDRLVLGLRLLEIAGVEIGFLRSAVAIEPVPLPAVGVTIRSLLLTIDSSSIGESSNLLTISIGSAIRVAVLPLAIAIGIPIGETVLPLAVAIAIHGTTVGESIAIAIDSSNSVDHQVDSGIICQFRGDCGLDEVASSCHKVGCSFLNNNETWGGSSGGGSKSNINLLAIVFNG